MNSVVKSKNVPTNVGSWRFITKAQGILTFLVNYVANGMKTLLRTASDDNEKNHCSYSNSVTVVSVN
jgi:hypothetical protein